MNDEGYAKTFRLYEAARTEYARLQEDLHRFLARYTGATDATEADFQIQDLGRMEGLREQRDAAYETFRDLEREMFDRLGSNWGYSRKFPERHD